MSFRAIARILGVNKRTVMRALIDQPNLRGKMSWILEPEGQE